MDRGECVYRLDFYHHQILDYQIHAITKIEPDPSIDDG
jgi:hypothetical protein